MNETLIDPKTLIANHEQRVICVGIMLGILRNTQ